MAVHMSIKGLVYCLIVSVVFGFSPTKLAAPKSLKTPMKMQGDGLKIDMKGKKVFVGGVADSTGYGWAIAKACAEAGADIILGTWPPVLPMFQMGIDRDQFTEDSTLSNGSKMKIAKV